MLAHLGLRRGGPINQFCRILTRSIIDLVRVSLSANPSRAGREEYQINYRRGLARVH